MTALVVVLVAPISMTRAWNGSKPASNPTADEISAVESSTASVQAILLGWRI
ncbi:MAG TPA: hypothetical protein VI357_27685 [Mycobacteriales bacterium]